MAYGWDQIKALNDRIAELEAENARLREALMKAQACLDLAALPSFADPPWRIDVEHLGHRMGFGNLMASASAIWAERLQTTGGAPAGGAFVSGPCRATVEATLSVVNAALQPQETTDGG